MSQREPRLITRNDRVNVLKHLNVLVAEIQWGTLVMPGDPNYVLLSKAAETIDRFLHSVGIPGQNNDNPAASDDMLLVFDPSLSGWDPYNNADLCDLEIGFWDSLAEHPFLSNMVPDIPEAPREAVDGV